MADKINIWMAVGLDSKRKGNLDGAIRCLVSAKETSKQFILQHHDPSQQDHYRRMSAVCSVELSEILLLLKNFGDAFAEASSAVATDPSFYKGHLHLGRMLKQAKNPEAITAFFSALNCAELGETQLSEIIQELLDYRVEPYLQIAENLSQYAFPGKVWTALICDLSKKQRWKDILYILTKPQGFALARSARACNVNYTSLLKLKAKEWRQWAEELLVKLLNRGATPNYLVEHRQLPLLHATVFQCLEQGSEKLLEHILRTCKSAEKNAMDSGGNTLLQNVCEKFNLIKIKFITRLMNNGVNGCLILKYSLSELCSVPTKPTMETTSKETLPETTKLQRDLTEVSTSGTADPRAEFERLKNGAKLLKDQGRIKESLEAFLLAKDVAIENESVLLKRHVADVFVSCSELHVACGELEQATNMAAISIEKDPMWYKGFYQYGLVLKKVDWKYGVERPFFHALDRLRSSSHDDTKVIILEELVDLLPNEPIDAELRKHYSLSRSVWTKLLPLLCEHCKWKAVHYLLVSPGNRQELAGSLDISDLQVQGVHDMTSKEWTLYGKAVLMELAKRGCRLNLALPEEPLLHAVLGLCAKHGTPDAFKNLFPFLHCDVNEKNASGKTVLETVDSYSRIRYVQKITMKRFLQKNGASTQKPGKVKNEKGKQVGKLKKVEDCDCDALINTLSTEEKCSTRKKIKHLMSTYTEVLKKNHEKCLAKYKNDIEENMQKLLGYIGQDDINDAGSWEETIHFLRHFKQKFPGNKCLASKVSIVAYLDNSCQKTCDHQKLVDGLKTVLMLGAPPDGLQATTARPLQVALNLNDALIVKTLLCFDAHPDLVATQDFEGESIFHRTLKMGIKSGSLEIFEKCCQLVKPESCDFKCIQDKHGNSLLHVVTKMKPSQYIINIVDHLCTIGVDTSLRNSEGKRAIDHLRRNDGHYAVLNKATRKKEKRCNELTKQKPIVEESVNKAQTAKENIRKSEHDAHEPDESCVDDAKECEGRIRMLVSLMVDQPTYMDKKKARKKKTLKKEETLELEDVVLNDDLVEEPVEKVVHGTENDSAEDEGAMQDEDCISINFSELEWEIECTAEVWKTLQSKTIKKCVKEQIVRKIKQLAAGEWRPKLRKPLVGTPDNVKLYEARVDQKVRILWECAISFSSRRSDIAEKRLANDAKETTTGRIYSEIIRIWRVVFDHDNVNRIKELISKSITRGSSCILQKKLKGLTVKEFKKGDETQIKLPTLFTEYKDDSNAKPQQMLCPPASANETEFNVMKFYSFSSALVATILSDTAGKVDFPFHVSELEDAIIKLESKTAILLLGRSGTGKTTCCLYRLWASFISYWSRAHVDGPLMPRPHLNCGKDHVSESSVVAECGESLDGSPTPKAVSEDDHLHQVFVTKNVVLCTEVKKNFLDMCHGNPAASHYVNCEDKRLPNKLKDVDDSAYPLFVTSKQFLILLDGSLPEPHFFRRSASGQIVKPVRGWDLTDEDELPDLHDPFEDYDDSESDDEETEEEEDAAAQRRDEEIKDIRRSVTYEVFSHELWPKIKQDGFQASLVWEEIMSFIKGSIEALESDDGYLLKEDYVNLGKKRAPNYCHLRDTIYAIFLKYKKQLRSRAMFDECDVVYHIYKRLKEEALPRWFIHEVYVDETQDFTQAELSLLIRCCQDPNRMFLTGDTAQNIMRGISFRFKDLKSLFHYARESSINVHVPRKVHTLPYNYRSHEGVLGMASSVVDLMTRYFPESFDKLNKDQGLFHGPKPILFESCNFDELALILRSNIRKTSHIEFGAHQVILVADDEARNRLPEELNLCLALTVYEAKGLEFDDILIYNFFKDSPVSKAWRVVTGYLKEINETKAHSGGRKEVEEINIGEVEEPKSRPLPFEKCEHQILISEFKSLYTAITRARVNVWIFDEDEEKRAPMFEYFKQRGIAEVIKMKNEDGGNVLADQTPERLFMVESTPSDWKKRADEFYKNKLFKVAAKAYSRAGEERKRKECLAHLRWKNIKAIKSPKKQKEEFMVISEMFLNCGDYESAARCLLRSRKLQLAAQLYYKIGMYESASKLFLHIGSMDDAAKSIEKSEKGNYRKAVKIMCEKGTLIGFERALDLIDLAERRDDIPATYKPLVTRRDVSREIIQLCRRSGLYHRMLTEIKKLDSKVDQWDMLRNNISNDSCLQYAVKLLLEQDKHQEAAILFRGHGKLKEAAEISKEKWFQVQCYVAIARRNHFENMVVESDLKMALTTSKSEKKENYAEALLLAGMAQKDGKEKQRLLEDAFLQFKTSHHALGMLDSVRELVKLKEGAHLKKLVYTISELKTLLSALKFEDPSPSKLLIKKLSLLYLGLSAESTNAGASSGTLHVLIKEGSRYAHMFPSRNNIDSEENSKIIDFKKYEKNIVKYLEEEVEALIEKAVGLLEGNRQKVYICPQHKAGYICSDSQHLHSVDDSQLQSLRLQHFITWLILKGATSDESLASTCDEMVSVVFPTGGTSRFVDSTLVKAFRAESDVVDLALRSFGLNWEKAKNGGGLSTNDHMKLIYTYLLFGKKRDDIGKVLGTVEKEHSKVKSQFQVGGAFKCIKDERGKPVYISHTRHLCNFFNQLYAKGDPHEAIGCLNQFFGKLCFKSVYYYPSLADACCLLELEVVLCLAMFARHSNKTVLLPASYLKHAKLWDALNYDPKNKNPNMFTVIQNYVPHDDWITHLISRGVEYMFKLISGNKSREFNIIYDSFSNECEDFLKSGESERVLILSLVLLCNCGQVFPWSFHKFVHEELLHVEFHEGITYPERIRTCLDEIQAAPSLKGVAEALSKLLHVRNDEYLYTCRWTWEGHPRGVRGLKFEKTTNYGLLSRYPLPGGSQSSVPSGRVGKIQPRELSTSGEQNESVTERKREDLPTSARNSDTNQSSNASNTSEIDVDVHGLKVEGQSVMFPTAEITRIEQQSWQLVDEEDYDEDVGDINNEDLEEIKQQQQSEHKEDNSPESHDFMEKFMIDVNYCGICDVRLSQSTTRQVSIEEENDAGESIDDTVDDHENTYECHIQSVDHKKRERQYREFCIAEKDHWLPLLKDVDFFLSQTTNEDTIHVETLKNRKQELEKDIENCRNLCAWDLAAGAGRLLSEALSRAAQAIQSQPRTEGDGNSDDENPEVTRAILQPEEDDEPNTVDDFTLVKSRRQRKNRQRKKKR